MSEAQPRGSCGVGGCNSAVYARGHCERHYRQLLRKGAVQPDRAPVECAVTGCGRKAVTRGWCHGHYLRWSRAGDVKADVPLTRPRRDECKHSNCTRGAHSAGYCRTHYERLRVHGDADAGGAIRTVTGNGHLSHGYWILPVGEDELRLTGGVRWVGEHRLVMARALGRPLAADESVHHRDGDRLNNEPANLELWSSAQPSGQRVEDKLAFAWRLIWRYEEEFLRFVGADVDPETGATISLDEARARALGPDESQ